MTSPRPLHRRPILWIAVAAVVVLVGGGVATWAVLAAPTTTAAPTSTVSATPTPSATPSASPEPVETPTGYAENTEDYDLAGLPVVDVFAVIPELPVDDDPYGEFTGDLVHAAASSIPVFADPAGDPVAALPAEAQFDGTSVPVVERQDHWVRVLLTGRSAVPSEGDPSQVTGWVRAADVEFSTVESTVEVDIAARTIDIVDADGNRERVADDFGWGVEATPTPVGRSFIMTTRVEPSFGYTRGYPLVYLSVQSPTLDGFGGANVAVTAFHYHDARSGSISNGCLRLDPDAITRLAELPLGTPVVVRS